MQVPLGNFVLAANRVEREAPQRCNPAPSVRRQATECPRVTGPREAPPTFPHGLNASRITSFFNIFADASGVGRAGSARVSLDSLLVSDPCVVGLQPRRAPGASLAEQVPALIERDLDLSEPLTVGIGHVQVRFPLEKLVLLARKLVDPAEYLRVVHGRPPVVLVMTRRREALRPI